MFYSESLTEMEHNLEEFLHKVFYQYLLIQPFDRTVYVTENFLFPQAFYSILLKILFQKFLVMNVFLVVQNFLPIFLTGKQTGIILEVGFLSS
jgi:actin-related protein 10